MGFALALASLFISPNYQGLLLLIVVEELKKRVCNWLEQIQFQKSDCRY